MQPKISFGGAAFMIAFAVIIDGVQAFLTWTVIGIVFTPFISIIALIVLGLSFAHYGTGMFKSRELGWIGTVVGELVPGLNALPIWTFSTVANISIHNATSFIQDLRGTKRQYNVEDEAPTLL